MTLFGNCNTGMNKSDHNCFFFCRTGFSIIFSWMCSLKSIFDFSYKNKSYSTSHRSEALSVWRLLQKHSSQKALSWHSYRHQRFFKEGSSPKKIKLTSFTIKYLGSCNFYPDRYQGKSDKWFLCYKHRCGVWFPETSRDDVQIQRKVLYLSYSQY